MKKLRALIIITFFLGANTLLQAQKDVWYCIQWIEGSGAARPRIPGMSMLGSDSRTVKQGSEKFTCTKINVDLNKPNVTTDKVDLKRGTTTWTVKSDGTIRLDIEDYGPQGFSGFLYVGDFANNSLVEANKVRFNYLDRYKNTSGYFQTSIK